MTAPISEPDRWKRLSRISQDFSNLLSSPTLFWCFVLMQMYGLVSTSFNITLMGNGSALVSNFIYIWNTPKLFGIEAPYKNIMGGLQQGSQAVFISTGSYNGNLSIGLRADKAVFKSEEEIKRFVGLIKEELRSFGENIV
jgi:hypothetical protein